MKGFRIIVIHKKALYALIALSIIVVAVSAYILVRLIQLPANTFIDPKSGIIVVDAGHGGIDGGTNLEGILEKEINLAIAKKTKAYLNQNQYKVVMTREEDVSLDSPDDSGASRHQRDLSSRVNIINGSNAQLFVSIHVNCNLKKPTTDGSIVFYSDNLQENRALAYCIQRALNSLVVNGRKRTVHDPQPAGFFILSHSKIPGVIVETAFISNAEERALLTTDAYREQIAKAISDGVCKYLAEPNKVFAPK